MTPTEPEPATIHTGTIRLWNHDRGFGFIVDDNPGYPDTFFHISAWRERLLARSPNEETEEPEIGDRVQFILVMSQRQPGNAEARNVQRIHEQAVQ